MAGPPAIRPMGAADGPAVLAIYAEGLATGNATLETVVPGWAAWDAGHHPAPRLVAETGAQLLGWAALSPVSSRAVYRGVAEVSIYVSAAARGRGVGRALMTALVTASEAAGFWTLQASILAENAASLALHQQAGFRVLGRRERIGQREGRWRDTIILERRSPVVG